MGKAVRAGITLTLLAGFLPSSSSLLAPVQSPKGTCGGMSLLLVAFFPLLIVKTQGSKEIFFVFNSTPCLVDAFTKQTAESIQVPVPPICPEAIPSPMMHCFCKRLDSSPAFTLQMQGGQGSAGLQRSYCGVGM